MRPTSWFSLFALLFPYLSARCIATGNSFFFPNSKWCLLKLDRNSLLAGDQHKSLNWSQCSKVNVMSSSNSYRIEVMIKQPSLYKQLVSSTIIIRMNNEQPTPNLFNNMFVGCGFGPKSLIKNQHEFKSQFLQSLRLARTRCPKFGASITLPSMPVRNAQPIHLSTISSVAANQRARRVFLQTKFLQP